MFEFFKRRGKTLDEYLNQTKDLKIRGVHFKIKKINMIDHLNGSTVLTENYQLYRKPSTETATLAVNKLKEHYRHVFLACVVEPELSKKEDEPGKTFVDNIFMDMEIAHELYMEIMIYTHGKKKVMNVLKQYL